MLSEEALFYIGLSERLLEKGVEGIVGRWKQDKLRAVAPCVRIVVMELY